MSLIASDHQGKTSEIFWGEIAPCEHFVQIYKDDRAFLGALKGFVEAGLRAGDGVVVVATPAHLAVLEERLRASGIDTKLAAMEEQYIGLDAEQTLAKFMVRGWPDEILFERIVAELLERAGKGGRRVRAFGEMVALLWEDGHSGATVRLEHLWHRLCQEKRFPLFCAYPRAGFTKDADLSIKEICAAHSKFALDTASETDRDVA